MDSATCIATDTDTGPDAVPHRTTVPGSASAAEPVTARRGGAGGDTDSDPVFGPGSGDGGCPAQRSPVGYPAGGWS